MGVVCIYSPNGFKTIILQLQKLKIFKTIYVLNKFYARYLLTFLIQLFNCYAFSQVNSGYNFTVSSGAYSAISGGTQLCTGTTDDAVYLKFYPFNEGYGSKIIKLSLT